MGFEDLTPAERAELRARIARQAESLAEEFAGLFSKETVNRCVDESLAALANTKVVQFVPVITARFARERLMAAAQASGLVGKDRPEILFVCVHNAGRSQMAAVLAQHLSGDRVNVRSAGSQPANEINPAVVAAMAELGLDISQEFPKPLTDDVVRAADVVITMGCGDTCPVYPGKRYLDWVVDDPAGADEERVRSIRDDIRTRVEGLLAELGVAVIA